MSSLETKELEFARQVRRALDENAASIPSATVDRLAAARRAALARKKPETVSAPVFVPAFAGAGMPQLELEAPQRRRSPLRRFALAWPLVALV
ncbi:MAG TPA: DUF3619 family protein, partial [Paraburkholderia sp.]|nr:DUF3619 family protein [Paraburkholderia sp.]